jgi:hypothetical protein
MYKLIKDFYSEKILNVQRLSDGTFIPLDPSNTDYQNFKYQINNDEAQLEDADGSVMSPEAAKAYVATLP